MYNPAFPLSFTMLNAKAKNNLHLSADHRTFPTDLDTSSLERRDGDGDDLRVAVRDADGGILDAGLGGGGFGVAVELQKSESQYEN